MRYDFVRLCILVLVLLSVPGLSWRNDYLLICLSLVCSVSLKPADPLPCFHKKRFGVLLVQTCGLLAKCFVFVTVR